MKKNICIFLITIFLLLPCVVKADGYIKVSPSTITVEQGSTAKITITAYNTIGDVEISSANSKIAKVNRNEWGTGMVEEKQTKKGTITVTGVNIGTTKITFKLDAATFDGGDLSGQTKTVTVKVVEKKVVIPKSKNNNIKSLTIEGYEINKINNNNYNLTVDNNVTKIKVNATLEDNKAKVTGVGSYDLKVGINKIKLIVTAESGAKRTVIINVTRKDGYYLEDLDDALKSNNNDIIITDNDVVTEEILNKIKNNQKEVNFNYFKNKNLLYSWKIDGSQIKDLKDFNPITLYTSNDKDNIYKLSNYADGIYISVKEKETIPNEAKLKLYVGDKFTSGDNVNLYNYDGKLNYIISTEVKNGYIEFIGSDCSNCFVTKSSIKVENENSLNESNNEESNNSSVSKKSKTNIFMIISVVETITLLGCVIYIIKLKK